MRTQRLDALRVMSHHGRSAARVGGACFAMGEAAGIAAATCGNDRRGVAEVDTTALAATLRTHGVFLGS